jgi:hypothetical protein
MRVAHIQTLETQGGGQVSNVTNETANPRESAVRLLLTTVIYPINEEIMKWHKLNEIKHKKQADYDAMEKCIREINAHANGARSQIPTFGIMGVKAINTLFVQFWADMAKYGGGDVFAAHKTLAQIEDVLLNIDY